MIVVRDDEELIALYLPVGTPWKRPIRPDGSVIRYPSEDWVLADDRWNENHVLHLITPRAAHAVWAKWSEHDGTFSGWYVNLQEPLRRTSVGFDYMDHMLDVVVAPDLATWTLKDEDELDEEVAAGLISPADAQDVRREAVRVTERIEAKASPFCDGWDRWKPNPSWATPGFSPGWDLVDPGYVNRGDGRSESIP